MRSSSGDTHNLAVAAKAQAGQMKDFAARMKDQADRTRELSDRTKIIAEQAIVQANAATAAARAAQRAATGSETQFNASERAWVSLDGISFSEPLHFAVDGASATIAYNLRNTGRSPAIDVTFASKLVPTSVTNGGRFFGEVLNWQSHDCETLRDMHNPESPTLFPGDSPRQERRRAYAR
jgi:hypothetical protein